MTTTNTKTGGAAPKKPSQTSAKKKAAGEGPEVKRPSDAWAETAKTHDSAQETSAETAAEQAAGADETQPAEGGAPDAEAARDEDPDAKYMRLAADFQNYKRRVEKEKIDIYTYANEKIAVGLLEVTDNFERALESSGSADVPDESFVKGMELIFKQLQDILQKNGVEEIQSLGEEFDPLLHHAVMMEETEDYESGKVSAVLSKGYKLKDRVIRPAMVKVAQ
jgi:molecular chaperone GrpE